MIAVCLVPIELLASIRAQHVELSQTVTVVPHTPLEKEMRDHIVCMCGTCGRKRSGECTCQVAEDMRTELAAQIAAHAPADPDLPRLRDALRHRQADHAS